MKKRKATPPKQKEFATSAFSALKGVETKQSVPSPVRSEEPPLKKVSEPDDMDLFLLAMSGVEQLGKPAPKTSPGEPAAPVKAIVRKIEASEQKLFLEVISGLKLDVRFHEEPPEELPSAKPGAGSRMKQLRRGTIRLDYELDLHGLTKDEALDALNSFVKGAYRRGQKAVLVITGRGNHSPDEPVLKSAVDKWLREAGKEMVVEFVSAPRQMGGDGAVVVFLRQAPGTP